MFFEAAQHVTAGGAYRKYLGSNGWAIEPEYSMMSEPSHVDNMFMFNVVKDLTKPAGRQVWYMIMGGRANYQLSDYRHLLGIGALGWGLGVKFRTKTRWHIAPQFRIDVEPNFRFSVFFGYARRQPPK